MSELRVRDPRNTIIVLYGNMGDRRYQDDVSGWCGIVVSIGGMVTLEGESIYAAINRTFV